MPCTQERSLDGSHELPGLDLADPDREWDSDGAGAEDKPNERYRDAHIWYDADNQDKFTAYKLLICDVVDEKLVAVLAAERAST